MTKPSRRKKRPGAPENKPNLVKDPENQTTETQHLRIRPQIYWALATSCNLVIHVFIFPLVSSKGLDLLSMLSLQWDVALEQWASRVSPKLASPHLPLAFFLFQDAAFVCALAWSVFTTHLFLLAMGEMLSLP